MTFHLAARVTFPKFEYDTNKKKVEYGAVLRYTSHRLIIIIRFLKIWNVYIIYVNDSLIDIIIILYRLKVHEAKKKKLWGIYPLVPPRLHPCSIERLNDIFRPYTPIMCDRSSHTRAPRPYCDTRTY